MRALRPLALLASLCLASCDGAERPAGNDKPAEPAKPEPAKPARAEPADPAGDPEARRLAEQLAAAKAQQDDRDVILQAYRDGTLGDRLVADKRLLVDPKLQDVKTVAYYLFKGTLADPPRDQGALARAKGSTGEEPRGLLYGGVDASEPALFDDIEPGPYTLCVFVGPPVDPEEERVVDAVVAEFEARPGFAITPESLAAIAAEVEKRLGRKPKHAGWTGKDPRCQALTIGPDPASRIVALSPAPAPTPPPAPSTAPSVVGVGGWRVKSAKSSDGAAVALPESVVRAVTPCLRTVKTPQAEVQIAVAGGVVKKVDVHKNNLKCVEELPGTRAPGLADGELTVIFAR